ncbi:PEP-CTERM sorting domain-containing protein [Novosphingobium lindaniclasticum]|uniref:PEP-CTERM sorting domain-containing protein n=1 Tax=Novosphingobium lindaniclasticum TaxID=1329895 RepID=UPI00040D5263|nr:PEP-CTERM sorting domain-containing protein [Novosphingobium lindaniclasticum]
MPCYRCLSVLVAASLTPASVFAADATRLPEPSGLFLLAMGVADVVIGRKFSRNRPD